MNGRLLSKELPLLDSNLAFWSEITKFNKARALSRLPNSHSPIAVLKKKCFPQIVAAFLNSFHLRTFCPFIVISPATRGLET